MGIDTSFALSGIVESTPKSWPVCDRCTKRLQRRYPVETFGIESRERAKSLGMRETLVLVAECHGQREFADVEIPAWMTEAKMLRLFSKLLFFQHGGRKAEHNAIVRI